MTPSLRKTLFRPCIDLHDGRVKQIVGGTLRDGPARPETNFTSEHHAADYAERYRNDGLKGGHVIMLGPGNEAEAKAALHAYPGGLQIGGGINETNAREWLKYGASHVIVTSALFPDGAFNEARLKTISELTSPERLVIDLSCRRAADGWYAAMNRWQTLTDFKLSPEAFDRLAPYCDEFLIHAADVEGRCEGIDNALVAMLGRWRQRPVTYAGGVRSIDELNLIQTLSDGAVDVTIGSALDLFGGELIKYSDCLAYNRR